MHLAPKQPPVPGSRPSRVAVLLVDPSNEGSCGRFLQAFAALLPLGFDLALPPPDLFEDRTPSRRERIEALLLDRVDLAIVTRALGPELSRTENLDGLRVPMLEKALARGIKVVLATRDPSDTFEPARLAQEPCATPSLLSDPLLERSDAAMVATRQQVAVFHGSGLPVHLLPDSIDPRRCRRRPRKSEEPRLGWCGTVGEIEGLLMVLPAIRRLQARFPFDLEVLGIVNKPVDVTADWLRSGRAGRKLPRTTYSRLFLELADQLRHVRHRHVPLANRAQFVDRLPGLDIDVGICPLSDSPEDRLRSALRFYEYAACGVMTLASRVPTYQDEVSALVDNDPAAWEEEIEHYLRVAADREAELSVQEHFVYSERDIRNLRYDWATALERILGRGRGLPSNALAIPS